MTSMEEVDENLDTANASDGIVHRNFNAPSSFDVKSKVFRFPFHDLQQHIRNIHIIEKPFKCEICKAGFNYKSNLKAHAAQHFKNITFKCNKCEKKFENLATLKKHNVWHLKRENEKKLEEITSKMSLNVAASKATIKNLLGAKEISQTITQSLLKPEKPEIMHIESLPHLNLLSFSQSSAQSNLSDNATVSQLDNVYGALNTLPSTSTSILKTKTFTGDTNYNENSINIPKQSAQRKKQQQQQQPFKHQCLKCLKFFKFKCSLNRHVRTHTGEKPYKCRICPKAYADSTNLKRHANCHKKAADEVAEEYRKLQGKNRKLVTTPTESVYKTADPGPDGIEQLEHYVLSELNENQMISGIHGEQIVNVGDTFYLNVGRYENIENTEDNSNMYRIATNLSEFDLDENDKNVILVYCDDLPNSPNIQLTEIHTDDLNVDNGKACSLVETDMEVDQNSVVRTNVENIEGFGGDNYSAVTTDMEDIHSVIVNDMEAHENMANGDSLDHVYSDTPAFGVENIVGLNQIGVNSINGQYQISYEDQDLHLKKTITLPLYIEK